MCPGGKFNLIYFPLYSDSNKQEKPTQFIYKIFRNPIQWYNTTRYDFIPSNSDVYPVSMDCLENLLGPSSLDFKSAELN